MLLPSSGIPEEPWGHLAGWIMSNRKSNIERNNWAIQLLEIKPVDNLLEIGFGPGVTIQKIARIATEGSVYGIDHSETMMRQATRRAKLEIESGRLRLALGSISDLPQFPGFFDKMLDVNSFQFWTQKIEALANIRHHMENDGRIVLVHQPRQPGATEQDAIESGRNFSGLLTEAGFQIEKIVLKSMKPVSVVGVVGIGGT